MIARAPLAMLLLVARGAIVGLSLRGRLGGVRTMAIDDNVAHPPALVVILQ